MIARPLSRPKEWGRVTKVYASPTTAVDALRVRRGGYCSLHLHRHKFNLFHVERGGLLVYSYSSEGGRWRRVTRQELKPGDSWTVSPGVVHRFFAPRPARVLEVYWASDEGVVDEGDIQRFSSGGISR